MSLRLAQLHIYGEHLEFVSIHVLCSWQSAHGLSRCATSDGPTCGRRAAGKRMFRYCVLLSLHAVKRELC